MRTRRRATTRVLVLSAAATAALLLGAGSPAGALTTPACLAKKLKAWGKLRKCQATENAKALQAKPANPGKCQTKHDAKIASVSAQAAGAAVACRFGVNGDGTVTDYDTGLAWEQKTDDGSVHDKDNLYTWGTAGSANGTAFTGLLSSLNAGASDDATTVTGCFGGHCDWRLPSITELPTILLAPFPCGTFPCVDQAVFGPTVGLSYWSATTLGAGPALAWVVRFSDGGADTEGKVLDRPARAVRSQL